MGTIIITLTISDLRWWLFWTWNFN